VNNALPNAPKFVGLFADQPISDVNRTIQACGLDSAQLCGAESLEYCRQTEAQVIKVLHVPDSASGENDAAEFASHLKNHADTGNLVTLDRLVEGLQGGTGKSFDWSVAASLSTLGHSFLLAGGLTPDNVSAAVSTVNPWGVDVSSGVETGGTKDPEKIKQFIRAARTSPQAA
jgi:phosphoribosylanthranilate isomerase